MPTLRAIDPTQPGANAFLDQGLWTHEPDVRDIPPGTTGLPPFIVHEAHCQQAKQKDKQAWKKSHDAYQAAPFALTRYFLDPDLFQMLAHSARLQLPEQPLHIPSWRQAGCLTFHLRLSHVLRVGHLQPLKAWRSLLYPSPARLPMCWGVTDLPLLTPHDLPSPALTDTARWLVRGLHCHWCRHQTPLAACRGWRSLDRGSPPCLASCSPWPACGLAAGPLLANSRDLHLLTMATGVLLSLLTCKTELVARGVYGAGKTQCIAILAAYFALRGHHVYYASRENTIPLLPWLPL